MRYFRLTSLQWAMGGFCILLGVVMLVAPHRFDLLSLPWTRFFIQFLGIGFLLTGHAILIVLVYKPLNLLAVGITERERLLAEVEAEHQRVEELAKTLGQERDTLQTIMENTHAHLAYLDADFNFIRVNSAYARGSGQMEQELIGRNHFDLFPNQENEAIFKQVKESGQPVRFQAKPFEYTDQPERGLTYWDWTLVPVKDETGRVQGLVFSLLEVTGRVRAAHERERLLEENQRRAAEAEEGKSILEALMEYIPVGITIAEAPDVKIRMTSKYGQEMAGRPRQYLEEAPLAEQAERWQIFHSDGNTLADPAGLPLSRATLAGEIIRNEEWVLRRVDGSDLLILCNAGPIRDSQGVITGGVIAWSDITERKQAEEAIKSYAMQLERSNQELQDFANIASHDLQEPLRKVQAFGERLQARFGHALEADGLDYLQRMRASAARMQSMIDGLLEYSRVTTKAQPFVQVDLSRIAAEVISDLEVRIERTSGTVELGLLPTLHADPVQMRQLMQNLIANALKFHRPGTPPTVKVYGRLEPAQDAAGTKLAQIFVEDNGIGFDCTYVERIFQPFQRLHSWSEYEGTGIGLAICQKIVKRHDGAITAESVPGKGSRFIITLPL